MLGVAMTHATLSVQDGQLMMKVPGTCYQVSVSTGFTATAEKEEGGSP